MKLAVIGGGSTYTPEVIDGLVRLRDQLPVDDLYLHDTNAKNLFNAQARAYSHGCVRTEDAVGFAETLLQGTDWDHEKIYGTVASGKTVQANLATPMFLMDAGGMLVL